METARVLASPSGYLYAQPLAGLPFLTHCGEVHHCGDCSEALHAHAAFEFAYLVSGTTWWQAGSAAFQHSQGELFFALPRQPHGTALRAHPPYHKLVLGLHLAELRGGAETVRTLRSLFHQGRQVVRGAQGIESVMRGLILQAMTRRAGYGEVCAGYLHAFLGLLVQAVSAGPSGPRGSGPRPCDAVRRVISFMSHELHRRVKLEEMAEAAGLSVSQLCFHFRQDLGVAPAAYHLRMRLEAARDALLAPHTNVTHVAMEFGFSSSQHFAMDFRRTFGTTPLAWRRDGPDGARSAPPDHTAQGAEPSVSFRGFCRDTRPDLPL